MTTPSGLPLSALQYWAVARGSVAGRDSTAQFYDKLREAAVQFGDVGKIPDFATVTQLRSAAVSVRNAQERFQRSPTGNNIDASQIGSVPYGRSLEAQATMPIYHVGLNLTTADRDTGETTTEYRVVQFTGSLPDTKEELLGLVGQDAQALADTYGSTYIDHNVVEILAA